MGCVGKRTLGWKEGCWKRNRPGGELWCCWEKIVVHSIPRRGSKERKRNTESEGKNWPWADGQQNQVAKSGNRQCWPQGLFGGTSKGNDITITEKNFAKIAKGEGPVKRWGESAEGCRRRGGRERGGRWVRMTGLAFPRAVQKRPGGGLEKNIPGDTGASSLGKTRTMKTRKPRGVSQTKGLWKKSKGTPGLQHGKQCRGGRFRRKEQQETIGSVMDLGITETLFQLFQNRGGRGNWGKQGGGFGGQTKNTLHGW